MVTVNVKKVTLPEFEPFTLGADPEFEVVFRETQKVIPASNIDGLYDHETGQVGLDGGQNVGELRPRFALGWFELFNNVKTLIKNQLVTRLGKKYYPTAGSGVRFPTGGHIHFGERNPSHVLLENFDKWITLPLNSISDTKIRRSSYYGRLGQYRVVSSSRRRFEYRSAPSWIAHPDITKGVLCASYVLSKYPNKEIEGFYDLLAICSPEELEQIVIYWDLISKLKSMNVKMESFNIFTTWQIDK